MHFDSTERQKLYYELAGDIRNGAVLVLDANIYPWIRTPESDERSFQIFSKYALQADDITVFGLMDSAAELQKLGFFNKRRGGAIWSWPAESNEDLCKLRRLSNETRFTGFGVQQNIDETVELISEMGGVFVFSNPTTGGWRSISNHAKRRASKQGQTFLCISRGLGTFKLYYSGSTQDRNKLIEAIREVECFREHFTVQKN